MSSFIGKCDGYFCTIAFSVRMAHKNGETRSSIFFIKKKVCRLFSAHKLTISVQILSVPNNSYLHQKIFLSCNSPSKPNVVSYLLSASNYANNQRSGMWHAKNTAFNMLSKSCTWFMYKIMNSTYIFNSILKNLHYPKSTARVTLLFASLPKPMLSDTWWLIIKYQNTNSHSASELYFRFAYGLDYCAIRVRFSIQIGLPLFSTACKPVMRPIKPST